MTWTTNGTKYTKNTTQIGSEETSGSGGTDLDFHSETSENRKSVISSISSYVNLSSYPLPKAFFTNGKNQTKTTHAAVIVRARYEDGRLVPGNIKATDDDTQVLGEDIGGQDRFGLPIPSWITDGEDTRETLPQYSATYTPAAGGVPAERSGLDGAAEIQVVFGELTARVETNDGEPLSGESLAAGPVGFATDDSGTVDFLAPVGDTARIITLGGSFSEDVELTKDPDREADLVFAYGGVSVTARTPGGTPLGGANVNFGPFDLTLDENGYAEVNTVPLDFYTVTVFGFYEADIGMGAEGSTFNLVFGGPNTDFKDPRTGQLVETFDSVDIKVLDAASGNNVSETDVSMPGSKVTTGTGLNGRATVAVPPSKTDGLSVGDEFPVLVAGEDPRYKTKRATATVGGGITEIKTAIERSVYTSQM